MTATAARPAPPPPAPSNGSGPAGARIGIGSRRRVSWIVLGLLLVAGTSVAFLAALATRDARIAVLVAARDLQPGQPVELGDLQTVSINADANVPAVAADDASELVGRVPIVPLVSGTLLSPAMLADGTQVSDGETVVGARLAPGELPGERLFPGDRVALVSVDSGNATDSTGPDVLTIGSVFTIDQSVDTDDTIVALRVPLQSGASVANAAGQERLRLILVPASATLEQLRVDLEGANDAPDGAAGAQNQDRPG